MTGVSAPERTSLSHRPAPVITGEPETLPTRSFRGDASIMAGAMGVSAVLGVVQVLLLPKLLSVESFGAYRIFLLYAGYVGVLHLGIADGALLRWAPLTRNRVAQEWRWLAPRLLAGQVAAFAIGAVALAWTSGTLRTVGFGVFALAVVLNPLSLTQYALQTGRRFTALAVTTVAPTVIFLVGLLLVPPPGRSVPAVIMLYLAGIAITCVVAVARLSGDARAAGLATPVRVRALAATGSSVLVANVAAGLTQSIDRFVLSWAVPTATFALYAFASSALYVATTAAFGLSRAALPHAAHKSGAQRGAFLSNLERVLLIAFGVGCALVPLFDWLVARWLPAYVASLPVFHLLLVGALFWTAIQVVLVIALQACGQVKAQLRISLVGITTVGIAASAATLAHAPLWGVAAAAAGGMVATWSYAYAVARRVAGDAAPASGRRFLLVAMIQGATMLALGLSKLGPASATAVYVWIGGPTTVFVAWPLLSEWREARR